MFEVMTVEPDWAGRTEFFRILEPSTVPCRNKSESTRTSDIVAVLATHLDFKLAERTGAQQFPPNKPDANCLTKGEQMVTNANYCLSFLPAYFVPLSG